MLFWGKFAEDFILHLKRFRLGDSIREDKIIIPLCVQWVIEKVQKSRSRNIFDNHISEGIGWDGYMRIDTLQSSHIEELLVFHLERLDVQSSGFERFLHARRLKYFRWIFLHRFRIARLGKNGFFARKTTIFHHFFTQNIKYFFLPLCWLSLRIFG